MRPEHFSDECRDILCTWRQQYKGWNEKGNTWTDDERRNCIGMVLRDMDADDRLSYLVDWIVGMDETEADSIISALECRDDQALGRLVRTVIMRESHAPMVALIDNVSRPRRYVPVADDGFDYHGQAMAVAT